MNKAVARVSVGMPVYNGELYICDAIESILNQSFEDFELIISNNASTDGTDQLCRDYAKRDSRIKYVNKETNTGAYDNYNTVFVQSQGEYFKWASSNDYCAPSFLEKCVEVLEARDDVALCYPRTMLFDADRSADKEYVDDLNLQEESPSLRFVQFFERIGLNNVMNGLIRSRVLKQTILVKPYFSSDVVLMAEILLHGKYFEVPDFLYFRRMDEATSTKLMDKEELRKHYDPTLQREMLFQKWKLFRDYFSIASRATLSARERWNIYRYLLRQVRWARKELFCDVQQATRHYVRKLS